MWRTLSTLAFGVAVTSGAFGIASSPVAAQQPIGPHQHFVGLVNESHDDPIVHTACPGPTWPSRRGRVADGQTMSVAEVAEGSGNTGPFSQVYAWFAPAKSGSTPRQLTFRRYERQRPIPTSVRVPCDGDGTVVFSSCPYLAPCAHGWVTDEVAVRFVNILPRVGSASAQ